MGVPGLFVWLVKKYKNIILAKKGQADSLYLDANCLIHPSIQETLKNNPGWTNNYLIEEKMLDDIEKYIDMLVSIVEPKQLLYIYYP